MPNANTPKRTPHRLDAKETPKSERPTAVEDRMMIFLCVRRDDIKPDPRMVMKYPREIKKKSEPASP
jgi:hypothetical protein